jgi:hypothetical protein
MDPIKLKLVRAKVPVELEQENGTTLKLTLVEMDGTQRDAFLTDSAQRVEIDGQDEQGKNRVRIKNYDGLTAKLLVLCLQDEQGKPLTIAQVQAWPAQVQTALYKAAQELNKLDEKKKEGEAKNA